MRDISRRGFLAGAVAAVATGDKPLAWLAKVLGQIGHIGPDDIAFLRQQSDPVTERRRAALALIDRIYGRSTRNMPNRINGIDRNWAAWQQRTGELPPDFDSMPVSGFPPEPLEFEENGVVRPITSVQQWRKRRIWIQEQVSQWVLGTSYPDPEELRGVILRRRQTGDTTEIQVRVEFGPDFRASLRLDLFVPPGTGPFPAFLTNHLRARPWVNTAVRRGYLACIYRAIDPLYGVSDDTRAWANLYPTHDLSALGRWSWAASRAVDYLVTLPWVDSSRIATGGHSRNAKQALFAAAFDERIGAVAPSRGNNGSEISFRYSSTTYMSESLADLARAFPDWYSPRLRFFCGRENKLPVDENLVCALVAPRGLILSHAFHEHQGNALGIEQSYRSARKVYEFLGHPDNIALYQMPGEHPSTVEDVERYFDFFDTVFGRKQFPHMERWVHGYDFGEWRKLSGDIVDPARFPERKTGDFLIASGGSPIATPEAWAERKKEIAERIRWTLGETPVGIPYPTGIQSGTTTNDGWVDLLYERPIPGKSGIKLPFGDDLKADFYPPRGLPRNRVTNANTRMPVIIWLHSYSYATGYSQYPSMWEWFLEMGFGVLAFDQIGFGSRNEQAYQFYRRYPRWSLLGKMITDVRAAIAQVDSIAGVGQIFLAGYHLGAKLALWTAALDERVAGVAAICPFTPLRLDEPAKGTEGVRHYSHLHGLLPRLGYFVGQEKRIPVDYDEIVAMIAPRPVLISAPTLDRFANVEDVRLAVAESRKVYSLLGAEDKLTLHTPVAFNDFTGDVPGPMFDWMDTTHGPRTYMPPPLTPAQRQEQQRPAVRDTIPPLPNRAP